MSDEAKRREPRRYSPAMISSTASPERRFVDEGDYDALARECEELRAAMQLEGCMVTMRYHNKHMTALEAERDRLRERLEEMEKIQTALALGQPAVEANKKLLARAERAEALLQDVAKGAIPYHEWDHPELPGNTLVSLNGSLPRSVLRRLAALADEEPSDGE